MAGLQKQCVIIAKNSFEIFINRDIQQKTLFAWDLELLLPSPKVESKPNKVHQKILSQNLFFNFLNIVTF